MASTKQATNRVMWVSPTGKKEIVTSAEAERRINEKAAK